MPLEIHILGGGDAARRAHVTPGLFDHAVDTQLCQQFLSDPRHHLAVAVDDGVIVGMASAVHYVHPDKPPELWVNEVGVAPSHQRRGIGRALLEALFARGRELGCREAWVLTDDANTATRGLYAATGGEETPAVMVSFRLMP